MATTAGGRGPPAAASIIAAAARPATVDYLTSLVRPHHRFVLIGDSSHGMAEQYALRADLSLALLNGGGGGGCPFHALVYESDWPEAFATNLWVRGCAGALTAGSARDALQPYRASRFPTWMWANEQFASFCTRLRELNAALAPAERKGVNGWNVYSFDTSMASLIAFYQAAGDKAGAAAARRWYACFADHGGGDSNRYAVSIARGSRGCETEALAQLVETMEKASAEAEAEARAAEERAAAEAGGGGGPAAPAPQPTAAAVLARERRLDAVSNARAVAAGEHYYRAMASRAGSTWNARDTAMVLTVRAVEEHVRADGVKEPRILVWAHDSHLGRAGSSEMSVRRGETNVGELLTTLYGREVLAVGQFTHSGTVAAARAWGRVVESRGVRPALPGSVEALFHAAVSVGAPPTFALDLRPDEIGNADVRSVLCQPRRVRNIGVIYRSAPAWMEIPAHYQAACLAAPPPGAQGEEEEGGEEPYGLFDVAVFQDASTAVTPLDPPPGWGTVVHPEDADGGDEDD